MSFGEKMFRKTRNLVENKQDYKRGNIVIAYKFSARDKEFLPKNKEPNYMFKCNTLNAILLYSTFKLTGNRFWRKKVWIGETLNVL